MEPIRVLYHTEDGTWWADSPDVPGWIGGADTFDETRRLVEEGIPWALERDDVVLEHYVPAPSVVAAEAAPTEPPMRAAS